MASEQIIAVASDALRGLLQTALPEDVAAVHGAPRDGEATASLWLHLLRITQPPAVRTTPVIGPGGRRMRTDVQLHLDYLICGQASDALQAHALLGICLAALTQHPVMEVPTMRPLLSQPARLDTLLPGSLSLQWKMIDLSLQEQVAVWQALGATQRASMFWRADVNWRPGG